MAGNCTGDGTCQVHPTFEKALLAAVDNGSDRVETVLRTMFAELTRRLDESMADRLRLHQRLDEQAAKLATVYATMEALIREGHPLRRAEDPEPDMQPSTPRGGIFLPRWAAIGISGFILLLLALVVSERQLEVLKNPPKVIQQAAPKVGP